MPNPAQPFAPAKAALPLTALFALGLALRLFRPEFRSLWVDEAYSLNLARDGFSAILTGCAHDVHPPLYYFCLRIWMLVFGPGLLALRALSALLGAAAVPVVFRLADEIADRRTAWWSAFAVALAPYFIDLSRWARMPALLLLLSCLSIWAFIRVVKEPRWTRLAVWAAVTLAALYAHYFAFLVLLGEGMFLAFGAAEGRRAWRLWLAGGLAIALGFAPWIPVFLQQLALPHPVWRGEPVPGWTILKLPYYFFFFGNWEPATRWWPRLFLFAGLAWGAVAYGRAGKAAASPFQGRWIWLAVILAFLPVGLLVLYAQWRYNLVIPHYLGFSAVGFCLLAGAMLSRLRGWRVWAVGTLLLAGWSVPAANQYFSTYDYPQWREAASVIRTQARDGERVATYLAAYAQVMDYYLADRPPALGIPGPYSSVTNENLIRIPSERLDAWRRSLAALPGVWLVVGEGDPATAAAIEAGLAAEFGPPSARETFPKVRVLHFERSRAPAARP